jgi:hypothetical protein
MGHVKFLSAVADRSPSHVYDLENEVGLDPRRRAALAFARKLTRAPSEIRRSDVEALRAHFTDAEIVQIVFATCHFNTMNRLADAFGVPLERTNVFAPPPKPPAGSTPEVPKDSAPPPAPPPALAPETPAATTPESVPTPR